MHPGDLLKRTADVYASARTYVDRGRRRIVQVSGSEREQWTEEFATYLDRARGFRFDWPGAPYGSGVVLRPDASRVLTGAGDGIRIDPRVRSLLLSHCGPAAATGVATLLLPDRFRPGFLDEFHDAVVRGRALRSGFWCQRLVGRLRDHTEVTLWLDEERFLVRGLVDRTEFPAGRLAAEMRDAQLERRAHGSAAGLPRELLEQYFVPERLLAKKHWPYEKPRCDWRTTTRVLYEPQVDVPIDEAVFG